MNLKRLCGDDAFILLLQKKKEEAEIGLSFSKNFSHISDLTHYSPMLLFYTPWKHQKTFRYRKGGTKKQHRAVMD